jgi:hypothetical protein
MKGKKMAEYKSNTITITLPITMPLSERIHTVSQRIAEWISTFDEPFDLNTDVIHLAKYERNAKHSYHYVIDRAVKDPKRNP